MKKAILILSLFTALFVGHFAPKAFKYYCKDQQDETIFPVTEQKPFVIVIPSYNNEKWYERNLRSVFEQKYDNYRVIYIDDCSTDSTEQKVRQFVEDSGQQDRVQFIRNPSNLGAMANLYFAIHSCRSDEIVVTLDGDDWFAHDRVLPKLNQIYANSDVWLTYGSHIEYPSYQRSGWAKLLPSKIIKENKFRKHRWCASHLRTFYAGLFKRVKLQDLLYEGKFYGTTYDLACMFPMLEMAGSHSRYVKDILYVYNRATPLNDDKVRWEYQQMLEKYIRKLPAYAKLAALSQEDWEKKRADLVVFSYDRPMQLYAFLESAHRYLTNVASSVIIYRFSSEEFEKAYQQVKEAFPEVIFVQQNEDFKPLVLEAVFQTPSKYVVFAVDDIIVIENVDFADCITAMEKTGAYGFYLRLGKTIDYCYMLDRPQEVPPSMDLRNGIYAWQFKAGDADWRYPNTVDMTVYKKEDIRRIEKIKYTNPNTFEHNWACKADLKKVGLYYASPKIVNLPLNLVNISQNRHMGSFTAKELLEKFKEGLKIDIAPYKTLQHRSPHINHEVAFVKR